MSSVTSVKKKNREMEHGLHGLHGCARISENPSNPCHLCSIQTDFGTYRKIITDDRWAALILKTMQKYYLKLSNFRVTELDNRIYRIVHKKPFR